MSYQVLARKWRPRNFEQVVGQDAVKQALVNGLDNDRVHHAFLLTGTRGVGKTTLARILAKSLNCEQGVSSTPCGECGSCVDVDEGRFVDMLEIDAASKTGVDDIRDLIDNAQYSPTRGRYKVYIIDEVHMLSRNAFNGLLKTLEEPPPHVKFVLATTDADRIPVTILSRCLRFNLRRLLPDQIGDYLAQLLKAESIEAEPAAIIRIAQAADGSMRDGLSLLDQAIAFGGGKLAEQEVAQMLGSVDHAHLVSLIEAIVAADGDGMLETVAELSAQARDLESVLGGLAEILHRISLLHCAPGYRDAERSDWDSIEQLATRVSAADAQLFYQIAVQGARDLALAPDPRTGLEMALMRMMAFRPAEVVPADGSGQAPTGRTDAAPARPPAATPSSRSARPSRAPEPAKNTAPAVPPPTGSRGRAASPQARGGEGDVWHGLLERLDLKGPVRELARNIELESRTGDQWRFVIPESVSHYGSQALVQKLESELSSQLGQAVRLVINTSSRAVRTPAALTEDASRAARNEAERAIEQDPTVRELKDRLGAVVLDDSVQPLQ
jgi:DNA polymerase-3 subunit gamma/tau